MDFLSFRAVTVDPLLEMVRCVFKRREGGLRNLLFLMFANYGCYLFLLAERGHSYNYMLRVFEVRNRKAGKNYKKKLQKNTPGFRRRRLGSVQRGDEA